MSDNIEVEVGILKNQVSTLQNDMREVKGTVGPIREQQIVFGNDLKQLVESVNKLTSSSEKTTEKVDNILDDFHDSLLKQAESRQFWNWIRTNGPPFLTVILSSAAVIALIRVALMGFLGIK